MSMPAEQMPPPMPSAGWSPPPMGMAKQRPLGVTILAILTMLFGVIGIIGGAILLAAAGLGGAALAAAGYPAFIAGLLLIVGALVLIFGLIAIAAGLGLWRLRPWAWWLTMIVGVFSIIFGVVTFSWISVGLWLIIVIYLFVIRQHFGMGAPRPSMMPPAT